MELWISTVTFAPESAPALKFVASWPPSFSVFTLKPFVPIINQGKWHFAHFVWGEQHGIKHLTYHKAVFWWIVLPLAAVVAS